MCGICSLMHYEVGLCSSGAQGMIVSVAVEQCSLCRTQNFICWHDMAVPSQQLSVVPQELSKYTVPLPGWQRDHSPPSGSSQRRCSTCSTRTSQATCGSGPQDAQEQLCIYLLLA